MLGDREHNLNFVLNWADIAIVIQSMEALVVSMTLSYMTKTPVNEVKLFLYILS